jgi:hypothetical protein
MNLTFCAAIITALTGQAAMSQTQTATFVPVSDTSLYESPDGSLSNGAGEYLFSGTTIRYGLRHYALMRFDLSSIAPGSVVRSVSVFVNESHSIADSGTLILRRVLASWGEGASDASERGGGGADATSGDATWLHRFYPNVLWSVPGGDFSPVISGVAPVASEPGPVFWTSSPQLVSDVQAWVNGPAGNFGWMIDSTSRNSWTARRLDSRENRNPSVRPRLEVTYDAPCIGPVISIQPEGVTTCEGIAASVSVAVNGGGLLSYQWQIRATGAAAWQQLGAGPVQLSCGGTATASAAMGAATQILIEPCPGVRSYEARCVVVGSCATVLNESALISMCSCLGCPADFNQDGGIDGSDVSTFFGSWDSGSCDADVNQDGGVDGGDVETFFHAWESGGC